MKKSKSRQHRSTSHSIRRAKRQSRMESLEQRSMLAGNVVHNEYFPNDVNGDGMLNGLDLEIMVSEMKAARSASQSGSGASLEGEQSLFLDVNNDGRLTNEDLISTVNALSLEGEAAPSNFKINYDVEIQTTSSTTGEGGTGTIKVGDTFTLNIYVEDLSTVSDVDNSPNLTGILQAFVDIRMYEGGTTNLDTSSFIIADPTTDIQFGPTFDDVAASVPSNVTPWGARVPGTDNQFVEDGVLKWIGGFDTGAVPTSGPILLASITFQAVKETSASGIDFTIDVRPYELGSDISQEEVAFNQTLRDGQMVSDDQNLNATLLVGANTGGQTGEVVNFDGGSVRLVIEEADPINGANFDYYEVEQNFGDDDTADLPPVVEIGGVKYYVLDVLANDLDGAGNSVDYFTIDPSTLTQPDQGTVQIYTRSDINNDEITPTGITSSQVILYEVPAGVGDVTTSFSYSIIDDPMATNPIVEDTAEVVIFIEAIEFAPEASDIPLVIIPSDPNGPVSDNVLNYVTDADTPNSELIVEFFDENGDTLEASDLQGTFTPVDDGNGGFTGEFTYESDVPGLFERVLYRVTDPEGQSAEAYIEFETLLDSLITGVVYFDPNNNGIVDDNAGTTGIPELRIGGVLIQLVDGSGNPVMNPTTNEPYEVRTNANGEYSFAGIDAGTYGVVIVDPPFTRKGITSSGGFTANGSQINDIVIGSGDAAKATGLNFGYKGRDYNYIGYGDTVASSVDDSIVLAFSKSNGVATLEWYMVDQGWERLYQIQQDYAYLNLNNYAAQIAFEVNTSNEDLNALVVQGFSRSTSGYTVIAETADGIIIRINGSGGTVMTNLAAVDAAFADL